MWYLTYILVIGDTHIPDRADAIPERLLSIIEEGVPWDLAVFTGDFTSDEILNWFRRLGRRAYYVMGNMDYLPLPLKQVFELNGLKMGVYHGHGIYPRGDPRGLTRVASDMGVNLLFTGHTHSPFIKYGVTRSILLVNPGSLTGVWGGGGGSMRPSMFIIELRDQYKLHFKLYELRGERLNVNTYEVLLESNGWRISGQVS